MNIKVSYVTWRIIPKGEPSERIKSLLRFATRLNEQKGAAPTGGSNHGE